eukprot:7168155-Pyramimonas_sp.AAC.1
MACSWNASRRYGSNRSSARCRSSCRFRVLLLCGSAFFFGLGGAASSFGNCILRRHHGVADPSSESESPQCVRQGTARTASNLTVRAKSALAMPKSMRLPFPLSHVTPTSDLARAPPICWTNPVSATPATGALQPARTTHGPASAFTKPANDRTRSRLGPRKPAPGSQYADTKTTLPAFAWRFTAAKP